NPAEACRMWDEAAQNGLVHLSLAFNRGLCAEQRGDLDNALAHYDEAMSLSPGKFEVSEAINRTSAHQRALDEWGLRQSSEPENQS
ncbi:tetratricopeptide repeat protein, partial [Parasphingorhabdus sp.]|uniref:tetratricopeptide repeat protein n=1 Tax=Parasphingorhabdus sp. TaxID=2709688 RepID=UPI003C791718